MRPTDEHIAEWFKDHIVRESSPNVIVFGKPASSDCLLRFRVDGPYLIVTGDLGDAIYRWSERVTFPWLAGLDLHYFKSKCQASEVGRRFDEWDEEAARDRMKNWLEQCPDRLEKFNELDGDLALLSEGEWHSWLSRNVYEISDDGDGLWDIGMVTALRCRAHLIGLRLAVGAALKGGQRS